MKSNLMAVHYGQSTTLFDEEEAKRDAEIPPFFGGRSVVVGPAVFFGRKNYNTLQPENKFVDLPTDQNKFLYT